MPASAPGADPASEAASAAIPASSSAAGNHAADESDLERPPGREHFSEQEQLAEIALAQLAAQEGVYQRGNQSAFHLRQADARLLRHPGEIAGRHEADSAGDRVTVDGGDGDERTIRQRQQDVAHAFRRRVRIAAGGVQIHAGTKRRARPAQNQ